MKRHPIQLISSTQAETDNYPPPEWLPEGAHGDWRTVVGCLLAQRELSKADALLAERLAYALYLARKYSLVIEAEGAMIDLKPHPAMGALSKLDVAVNNYALRLGLGAGSRGRLPKDAREAAVEDDASGVWKGVAVK